MPFIGPLDYASHLRFTLRPQMHRYSSIPILYHFLVRIASMTGCYFFLRRMGVGPDGMTDVALPFPASQALRYIVLILVSTKWSFCRPNRAQTYARCCSRM